MRNEICLFDSKFSFNLYLVLNDDFFVVDKNIYKFLIVGLTLMMLCDCYRRFIGLKRVYSKLIK